MLLLLPSPNKWEPLLPPSMGEDATERAAEGKAPEVRPRWLTQARWSSSEEAVGATHAGATNLQIPVAWEPLAAPRGRRSSLLQLHEEL
jgi:hypothetical protein